jgi:hypothetical protein
MTINLVLVVLAVLLSLTTVAALPLTAGRSARATAWRHIALEVADALLIAAAAISSRPGLRQANCSAAMGKPWIDREGCPADASPQLRKYSLDVELIQPRPSPSRESNVGGVQHDQRDTG